MWTRRFTSASHTDYNERFSLLGIRLPDHSDYRSEEYSERLMLARLADNTEGADPYARLYDWPRKRACRRETVRHWIDEAPLDEGELLPTVAGPCY